MNINILFSIILVGLLTIFFLFKPLDLQQKVFTDVPLFELKQFTLHELDQFGLVTLMNGDNALKYANRYEVGGINYTDNSQDYIANMKANHGAYQDNTVTLDGDIFYLREDGITFETQKLVYNKESGIVVSKTPYTAFSGENVVKGVSLQYNNLLDQIESKKVIVKYKLGDTI